MLMRVLRYKQQLCCNLKYTHILSFISTQNLGSPLICTILTQILHFIWLFLAKWQQFPATIATLQRD